jgi:hypothetical protein
MIGQLSILDKRPPVSNCPFKRTRRLGGRRLHETYQEAGYAHTTLAIMCAVNTNTNLLLFNPPLDLSVFNDVYLFVASH